MTLFYRFNSWVLTHRFQESLSTELLKISFEFSMSFYMLLFVVIIVFICGKSGKVNLNGKSLL